MARRKGSKDRRPRKGSKPKPATAKPVATPTSTGAPIDVTPAETGDDQFRAAVEGVLGQRPFCQGGPSPHGPASPEQGTVGPLAAIEGDMVLGMDAWEALVQAPFRSLAILLRIPQFEQLGKLRAKMLAQPSYPIYRHYVTQWLTDNPDDELFIAKVITGAALVTVLQEGWLIYVGERQRRAAAAHVEPGKVSVDALHTNN